MHDTGSLLKDKTNFLPLKEWHTPRLIEVFYPLKISSTQDRHNWIAAMMLDARLNFRDRMILARLALHLNLKTGRCDPATHILALETSIPGTEETGRRVVRRSMQRAEKVGWVERTSRSSGSRINRSNSYRLTIPKDIREDKFDRSGGQNEQVGRTAGSSRIGKENREREYPYFVRPPAADQRGASEEASPSLPRKASYTAEQVERVRDLIEVRAANTVGAVVAASAGDLSGAQVAAMCRDGLFVRTGDKLSLVTGRRL